MHLIRPWQTVVLGGGLVLMVSCLGLCGAEPASDKPSAENPKRVGQMLEDYRNRAGGWACMGHFDEAVRELLEADRAFQAASPYLGNPPNPDHWPDRTNPLNWSVSSEIEAIRTRETAWRDMVARFKLPPRTLGNVSVVPYVRQDAAMMWSIVYTVGPEGLDKGRIGLDPASYRGGGYVPGSSSFILAVASDKPGPSLVESEFRKVATVEVPKGYAPCYLYNLVQRFQIALLVGGAERPESYPAGVMLLYDGKVPELKGGPCEGPAISTSSGATAIDALATHFPNTQVCALKRIGKGAIIGVYEAGFICHDIITFEGDRIVEHQVNRSRGWETDFKASEDKPVTRIQVLEILGPYYGLRHDLKARRHVQRGSWNSPREVTFDMDKREWRLVYGPPSAEIAGSHGTIVIDEKGKLVSLDQMDVPR